MTVEVLEAKGAEPGDHGRSPKVSTGRADGHTPVMRQFFRAKEQYPDAILFFRLGDFYEMFFEDAVVASAALDLTLTSRSKGPDGERIPMAGVPHHAATGYISGLLERGHKVAICEQMADPATVKGVVPREVVRVITPGLCLDPGALDARTHNFLLALVEGEGGAHGLAALELSTSELRITALANEVLVLAELGRFEPREVLVVGSRELEAVVRRACPKAAVRVRAKSSASEESTLLAGAFAEDVSRRETMNLGELERQAATVALAYAAEANPGASVRIDRVVRHDVGTTLVLDATAVLNLELVRTLGGDRKGSFLSCIDETRTPMGARLLRERILAPSVDVRVIGQRHEAVAALTEDAELRRSVRAILAGAGDLERAVTRAAHAIAGPRDLAQVRAGLERARELRAEVQASPQATNGGLASTFPADMAEDVLAEIGAILEDEPPASHTGGGVVRAGVSADLDELRNLSSHSKDLLFALEQRERASTGISSLKIKYTRVFGYYLEVTKSNLAGVPAHYRRKQTVANGERFTCEELDALQVKILGADERANALEAEHFFALRKAVASASTRILRVCQAMANLDVHSSFAELAARFGYARPTIDESDRLDIREGRHPVVEQSVPTGTFVPNDVALDTANRRLLLITGPNMAGKSTVMRQVALSVVLAQAGGFVPAESAHIGIVDRIHTRVGASDNLAMGRSTFMVEMTEAASILRHATRRSLVLLDEVGRGTSTYDGLALAQAIAEHIHDAIRCRTMFATHYHELCELEASRDGVVNMNVLAKETPDGIAFLHRLVPGGANRSYGLEVAKRAGLPGMVIARARAVLGELEADRGQAAGSSVRPVPTDADHESTKRNDATARILEALRAIEVEQTPPVDALLALQRLQSMFGD